MPSLMLQDIAHMQRQQGGSGQEQVNASAMGGPALPQQSVALAMYDFFSALMGGPSQEQAPQQPQEQSAGRAEKRSSSRSARFRSPIRHESPVYLDSSDAAGSSSGNETDLEEEEEARTADMYSALSVPLQATSESTDSYSLSDEAEVQQQIAAAQSTQLTPPRSNSPLEPCSFRSYGCEALVRSTTDEHYRSANSHHLSLCQARISVMVSQREQLLKLQGEFIAATQLREQHLQAKLARRDAQISRLRERQVRHKKKLRAAQSTQLHSVQELVSAYLNGGMPTDAAKLLRSQQKEIDSLRAELAAKEALLNNVAEHIRVRETRKDSKRAAAQAARSSKAPQQAAEEAEEETTMEQQQQQQQDAELAEAAALEAEAGAEGQETHAAIPVPNLDAAALAAAFPSVAARNNNASNSPAFKPMASFRLPTPVLSVPVLKPKLQSNLGARNGQGVNEQRRRAPAEHATHHYTVPHSSLKALSGVMSKASLSGVLGAALSPAHSAPAQQKQGPGGQAHQQHLREQKEAAVRVRQQQAEAFLIRLVNSVTEPQEQQQPPPRMPSSRGAAIGLDKFCPMTWKKSSSSYEGH